MSAAVLPSARGATSTAERPLRVALVGPIPPPYGGVSVHVQRLAAALEATGIQVVAVPDLHLPTTTGAGSLRWFAKLGASVDIVHYHTFETQYPVWRRFAALRMFGVPVVGTLHSFRDEPTTRSGRFRFLAGLALRRFSHVICVGSHIRQMALELGVSPARATVVPPYLPPVTGDAARAAVPKHVAHFISTRSPVLTANSFAIDVFKGEDKYGLDLCIELCRELVAEYPRIGFVFAYSQVGDQALFSALRQRIDSYGLQENFLLAEAPGEYWPILERSTVFVRPTNTDGYGISIAEALHFGLPAIASNVCERPEGTVLFRTRDREDLVEKTRRVLHAALTAPVNGSPPTGTLHRITAIYNSVSGRRQHHDLENGAAR